MKFKISAAAKNVKVPAKPELMEEADCEKGDVVLVKVTSSKSFIKYIRSPEAEKQYIKKGDIFLSVLSDRYAARVLEGKVPGHLKKGDMINLLEQGGTSGIVVSARPDFIPLELEFLGFALKNGEKLNLKDFAIPVAEIKKEPKLIISIGVDMESGKTTTTAGLVEGLIKNGCSACGGKITGIGNVNDIASYKRKGAKLVYGIIDAGYPSTANLSLQELEDIFMRIFSNLAAEGSEFVLLEIADGILQRETAMLLESRVIRKYKPEFILSCNDALGAYGGKLHLKDKFGIEPLVVCGLGTITELGRKEIEDITGIKALDPVAQSEELAEYVLKKFKSG